VVAIRCKGGDENLETDHHTFYPEHSRWIFVCRFEKFGRDSAPMDGCLENGRDLSAGLKYNNFGIHGARSANAADALAAVEEFVFDQKSVEPMRLLRALEDNFSNDEELRLRLREKAPKVGNNDDRADQWLVTLFEMFAEAGRAAGENGRGGRYRPGSGSAMYYVWLATGHEGMQEPVVGATADGRKPENFSAHHWLRRPTSSCTGP
jgi:pyruvate-formate lyase